MKRARKFLVFFLSCVLALPLATLAPITANAEGTLPDVDASGTFGTGRSPNIEVTDEQQTYTFISTTEENASYQWDTPAFLVYAGDGKELFAGRSDAYGWVGDKNTNGSLPEGYKYLKDNDPADWSSWLAANKAGANCKITMRKVDDYVVVGFNNNGVTSIVTIPSSGTASVVLTGEHCRLTNIMQSTDHVDLTSAIEQISGGGSGNEVPPGTFELVDTSSGFRYRESPHIAITATDQTYTFTSTTNANVSDNWATPIYFVLSESDAELFVGRSDAYGWALGDPDGKSTNNLPEGYQYQPSFAAPYVDWPSWVTANQNGVECKITMRQVGNYAVVGFYNNGVTSLAVIPNAGNASIVLSGDRCKLTNITASDAHLDLSAAVSLIPSEPEPDEPGPEEPGPDQPEPDTPGGDFLDCNEFWSAHTAGFEITADPHTYMFHTKTDEGKTDNWHTPLFVVFYSEDGKVNGPGYQEYGVIRSDNYHWDGTGTVGAICKATETFPEGFDWAAWQAANRNGVDCTVTTQMYNDCALIGVSNNGVVSTYAVPVNQAVANYVSLTGEFCVLSNLQTVDQHIDLSAARNSADNRHNASNNPPSEPAAPAAPAAPPSEVTAVAGGEVLSGSAWWTGMAIGSNQPMSGDGTWTWVVQASALMDGYGAFSVEIYDPATNGYITTGSDMNAWTAEGFNPAGATITGIPAELASNLVEGHVYAVTVTRSGNTFAVQYVDYTENREICNLTITPGEAVSRDVQIHVMAQVGTYATTFSAGTVADALSATKKSAGGEILKGTEWWTGMMRGSDRSMSGDGTWTWTVRASSLVDGYGAFSVEIYDPATNGYITTGSDKNAWTAEGFDPASASISGIPSQLDSKLVEGHTYAVTVTRSGNTFTVRYVDHTTGNELCNLVITPGETVGKDVKIHVMAQVGTFSTAFNAGTLIAALGDSVPVLLYVMLLVGIAAILYGFKKRFEK